MSPEASVTYRHLWLSRHTCVPPLARDFCALSLPDLLTPRPIIARRADIPRHWAEPVRWRPYLLSSPNTTRSRRQRRLVAGAAVQTIAHQHMLFLSLVSDWKIETVRV